MTETLHILCRVSSKAQAAEDKTSLKDQEFLGKACAKRLGLKPKVWNEGAQSASGEELEARPVMQELLEAVDDGLVKHLFVYNADRLARDDTSAAFIIRRKLFAAEVLIHTPGGKTDTASEEHKALYRLMEIFSQYDNRKRSQRSIKGKLEAAKRGFWHGGSCPFGYRVEDRMLVPDPDEAKVLRQIFHWYADGVSTMAIKVKLDSSGVRSRRGKLWAPGSIRAALKNTHAIGFYTYTDHARTNETVTIQRAALRVVEQNIWNAVEDRFKASESQHAASRRRRKHFYLLVGTLVCGSCGKVLAGRYLEKNKAKNSNAANKYYCPAPERNWVKKAAKAEDKWKRQRHCKMNRSLNRPTTDRIVWETLLQTVASSSILKETVKRSTQPIRGADVQKINKLKSQIRSKARRQETKLKQLQDALETLEIRLLMQEVSDLTYRGIRKRLDEEKTEFEAALAQLRIQEQEIVSERRWIDWVKLYERQIQDAQSLSDKDKKEYIEGLVESIAVDLNDDLTHRLTINYKLPIHGDSLAYWEAPKKGQPRGGYDIVDGDAQEVLERVSLKRTYISKKKINNGRL